MSCKSRIKLLLLRWPDSKALKAAATSPRKLVYMKKFGELKLVLPEARSLLLALSNNMKAV